MIPEDLRYTDAHEWVRDLGDGVVRIGITDHAQSQLGDVVFVQLPAVGDAVTAGASIGEVESDQVGLRHLRAGHRAPSSRSTTRSTTPRS